MVSYRFDGISPVTGGPIVGHLLYSTSNGKTGPGWQLAILDGSQHPLEAIKSGNDASICGNCPLRKDPVTGERACYVTPMALGQIYKKGPSRIANPAPSDLPRSSYVRLGMYGDPAMLPYDVVKGIAGRSKKFTGYTHQHEQPWYDRKFDALLMRSVESLAQAKKAWAEGARTYRADWEGLGPQENEIYCPYPKVQCADCGLCNGIGEKEERKTLKSIVIPPHGNGFKGSEAKKQLTALRVLGQ